MKGQLGPGQKAVFSMDVRSWELPVSTPEINFGECMLVYELMLGALCSWHRVGVLVGGLVELHVVHTETHQGLLLGRLIPSVAISWSWSHTRSDTGMVQG